MTSLSLPHSLPRSPPLLSSNQPRIIAPSFNQFPLFRCSANLRNSKNHQNSRANGRSTATRLPAKLEVERFASISSSSTQETSSVGVNPQISVPPPPTNVGSPLFWIGVGVGLSALFSWVATRLKNYAMQQAFKTLMGQMNPQDSQFNNAGFSPGSPFPFPSATGSGPFGSPFPPTSQHSTVDVSATRVDASATRVDAAPSAPAAPASSATEATPTTPITSTTPSTPTTDVKSDSELNKKSNRFAFVDVTPEETEQKSPFESSFKDVSEVSQNGAAFKQGADSFTSSQSTGKAKPAMSVEALEKMLEDPTVQKMVYPYLPEEMRNPTTFKWMLQNPQYRQQLEDMLNNMGGSSEWDNRMMDSLKNFDLSSPEVKQQFDQIGLSPEEVISKIMANPEVAMAFQNPRVQAAIMDVLPSIWESFTKEGKEQEEGIVKAKENLKYLEEELKGKKFFGGEKVGFVDIALGWLAYYESLFEDIAGMKVVTKEEFPLLSAWAATFADVPIIKDNLPSRDKLIAKYQAIRDSILKE